MSQEVNRYFVKSDHFAFTWYARVDTDDGHDNITPNLYSEFYADIRQFCKEQWPDGEGWDWTLDLRDGSIYIPDPKHFMLLKLALSA